MRVNIYAEEMTDRLEIIEKVIEGQTFTALRFYLELPVTIPNPNGGVNIHRGPFIHRPGDDDSSAVTFWGKQDLRHLLRKGLALLDAHYRQRDPLYAAMLNDDGIAEGRATGMEAASLDAITAALPLLLEERDVILLSNCLADDDGAPDRSTLDADGATVVAEYDRAIALCKEALRKAGVR